MSKIAVGVFKTWDGTEIEKGYLGGGGICLQLATWWRRQWSAEHFGGTGSNWM